MNPILLQLDVSKLGATTLQEMRDSLCAEMQAITPSEETSPEERCQARKTEGELLVAIGQIDKVFYSYGNTPRGSQKQTAKQLQIRKQIACVRLADVYSQAR
jgi:hypothetical protein